jgi:hypothetical protein
LFLVPYRLACRASEAFPIRRDVGGASEMAGPVQRKYGATAVTEYRAMKAARIVARKTTTIGSLGVGVALGLR